MKVFEDLEKENYYIQVEKGEMSRFKRMLAFGVSALGMNEELAMVDEFGALYLQILRLELDDDIPFRTEKKTEKLAISNSQLKGEFFSGGCR